MTTGKQICTCWSTSSSACCGMLAETLICRHPLEFLNPESARRRLEVSRAQKLLGTRNNANNGGRDPLLATRTSLPPTTERHSSRNDVHDLETSIDRRISFLRYPTRSLTAVLTKVFGIEIRDQAGGNPGGRAEKS